MSIAVLGTGLLGSGMVENLLAKGEQVRVWNRTAAKVAPLVAKGAVAAESPADAARGAERVHLVLAEDDPVDETIAALRPGLGEGVFVIDHSTNLPARVAERYARLRGEGVRYVHAPVFMSPQNGREGTGIMLLAAPQAEAEALRPGLSGMTGKVWHVGERPDMAAIHKLVGNGAIIALAGAMGDLLALGEAQGLSAEQVLSLFEVFRPALPYMGERVAAAGTRPASFELTMARKDVRLMIEAAGGPEGLVVLPAVATAMDEALAKGHGSQDFAIYASPRVRRRRK